MKRVFYFFYMKLLGIDFFVGKYADAIDTIEQLDVYRSRLIVTPNPEMLYDAMSDSQLYDILKSSDLAFPDGVGIFVAYQIQRSTLPVIAKYTLFSYWCLKAILHTSAFSSIFWERITWSRLTRDLLIRSIKSATPVIVIDPVVRGTTERDILKKTSQENMVQILWSRFPWIDVRLIVSDSVDECTKYLDDVSGKTIVIATHGNGVQEKLLFALKSRYRENGLFLGIGSSIDLMTWFRQSVPQLYQRFWGEWLYRFLQNPTRQYKRMKKIMIFFRMLIHKK